jgi:hypothetical protein
MLIRQHKLSLLKKEHMKNYEKYQNSVKHSPFLEKLIGPRLVKKLRHFTDNGGSLRSSQQRATCPYPVTGKSNPRPLALLSVRFILILHSYMCLGRQTGLFSSHFPTRIL